MSQHKGDKQGVVQRDWGPQGSERATGTRQCIFKGDPLIEDNIIPEQAL